MGKKNKQSKENKDVKDNKDNNKEASGNTSGGIRKFFARISRKRNKEKKNTNDIPPVNKDEEKCNKIGPDENNTVNKDVSGEGRTRRRSSSSTGRCKPGFTFPSTFENRLRNTQSEEDVNITVNQDTLQKDPQINKSDKLVLKLRNAASEDTACRIYGSVLRRPLLLTDCPAPKSFSQFTSLPSSPTHYEGKLEVSSRRSYASDPPSPSCNARYPDHRSRDHQSTNSTALKERRKKRQKYHAEKDTSCSDTTPEELVLPRNETSLRDDPREAENRNFGHPLSLESLLESQRKATTLRTAKNMMTFSKSDMESEGCVFSYDSNLDHLANGRGNVYRIDHVDSVSLQSVSPTSTLERQRSTRKRNKQEDRKLQTVDDNDVAPMIHYHLTIQNCDGINIYVNNPSTDNFCPSGIQVDDGGLLKRLSWSQSPSAPNSSVSNGSYHQQTSNTELPISASGKPGKKTDKSPDKHLQQYNTAAARACCSQLSDNRNITDFKSKGIDDKPSVSPWYINKNNHSSETKPTSQRTVPAATETPSRSVTQSTRGRDSSLVCDQENSQINKRNSSDVDNNADRRQTMTTPRVRPIAHVSPRRRAQPNVHIEQPMQRPVAQQQQQENSQHQQQEHFHHHHQEQHQQQWRQPSIQSGRTVLIQNNLPASDWTQRNQSEARELTSLFNYVSGSFSSLTTEALLEADANGDVSASDLDSTLNDESYSSSESTVSVVEVSANSYSRESRLADYRQDIRPRQSEQQRREEETRSRPASVERHPSYLPPTDLYQAPHNPSLRRIQSMRENSQTESQVYLL